MKRYPVALATLLLTSALFTPELVAAELHKDWLKHLSGTWASKDSMGTTGESKAELRLDGNLVVAKGKNSLGL